MPFTAIHLFLNYLAAIPVRKRIDIVALLAASVFPDMEGAYFTIGAYNACAPTDMVCLMEYPSHYLLHSFLGIILIIAPLALVVSIYLRKYLKVRALDLKIIYASALAGGLLHLIPDLTVHKGADALYLLWPAGQQFSFVFSGAMVFWGALAAVGIVVFVYFEREKLQG